MPGWHQATQALQEQGKLQMVGIIQEQHPDRCRLFMQWKKMNWPILVDSLNLAGISVVPITYAIDEQGIVRSINPRPETIGEFLATKYERLHALAEAPSKPPDLKQLKPSTAENTVSAWRRYADTLFLWGGASKLDESIEAYQRALRIDAGDSVTRFRLGVAYRRRYDLETRHADDFQNAVGQWTHALELDPNQYIWRRRIQQYGPRLAKPYPFYDWIEEARRDISARGETPYPLIVEPGGAEVAKPTKTFETVTVNETEPDAKGRIRRDRVPLIAIETAVVPSTIKAGEAARAHILFRPNAKIKAHWNNESEPLRLWVSTLKGWVADNQYLAAPNAPMEVSNETRELQFEIRAPEDVSPGRFTVAAYALYYVCEGINGTCLYRRQDINLILTIRK